jgi:uncharacterized protein YggE
MKFTMVRALSWSLVLAALCVVPVRSQQGTQAKFVADTLIVEAEGTYESDPDQALLAFDVSVQEKELKQAYAKASQAMRQIVEVAERNGLSKEAIQTGVLTITPYYEGGRNRRARAYTVLGHVELKVQDFSKVGPIMDDSVQEGIVDFRSLTYSLANEEAAKQKAVADAMQRALGRATVALQQSKQKLGPTRYVNLEVTNLAGISEVESLPLISRAALESGGLFGARKAPAPPPPPPPVRPGKIAITATVQCVFQIDR